MVRVVVVLLVKEEEGLGVWRLYVMVELLPYPL